MIPQYIIENLALREHLPAILPKNFSYCEVGVKEGTFFRIITSKTDGYCVAIDLWEHALLDTQNDANEPLEKMKEYRKAFQKEFGGNPNIDIFQGNSVDVAEFFKTINVKFDIVYIDADHSFDAVYSDLQAFYPLVKPGGILAGHDYIDVTFPSGHRNGVVDAVKKFSKEKSLNIITTGESFWRSFLLQV